jgi:hypothetical protein
MIYTVLYRSPHLKIKYKEKITFNNTVLAITLIPKQTSPFLQLWPRTTPTKVQIKLKRRMTSQSKHCDDGPTLEELLLSGHLVENVSIQSQTYEESLETTRHNPHKRSRSATPESVQNIKEVTSNDRLQISNNTIQNTKSSATLAQGSTGNAGDLLPFWNEYTQEESKKWWLPERFEFNYLFALIYCFYLLTFLLGPIVPFWIGACGMDL